MVKNSKSRKTHFSLRMVLLAVFCIGAAELAASRLYAPAFFHRVMDPVEQVFTAAADWTQHTVTAVREQAESQQEEREAPSIQLARKPLLEVPLIMADPALTELKAKGDQKILTGGALEVPYYRQSAPEWKDQPYGTDTIGSYGCGPTAMAMVISSMTDTSINPVEMASWAVENGQWASRSGSCLSLVEEAAQDFGLRAIPIETKTPDTLQDVFFSGGLVVALMGPGHFTDGGHFIVLRGVTLNGSCLIADPNSLERSLMEWDPQLILEELSPSTRNGAPLWAILPADGPY